MKDSRRKAMFHRLGNRDIVHIIDARGKRFDGLRSKADSMESEGKLKTPFKVAYFDGMEEYVKNLPRQRMTPIGPAYSVNHDQFVKNTLKKIELNKEILGIKKERKI